MAYRDAINYNRIRSMKGFPVGAIVPWSAGLDTIPTGWVLCNGANVAITRYPLLYECIGNSYGGTQSSTFRLPPLTEGSKGIVDIYKGYYQLLKNQGNSQDPGSSSLSSDDFWVNVGGSANGDEHTTTSSPNPSTVDLVGEISNPPNFIAKYGAIELFEGQEQFTISINPRKLSDRHMPTHSHGLDGSGEPSYSQLGGFSLQFTDSYNCGTRPGWDFLGLACSSRPCRCITSRSQTARTVTYIRRGNNQNDLRELFGAYGSPAGGGGSIFNFVPASFQEAAQGYAPGDGYAQGDMFARAGTVFFTSLSNREVRFSEITGHNHGTLDYQLQGKLNVISPGIVSNVTINTVTIDNQAGQNFGTISVTTATPNLTMLYIIKAF